MLLGSGEAEARTCHAQRLHQRLGEAEGHHLRHLELQAPANGEGGREARQQRRGVEVFTGSRVTAHASIRPAGTIMTAHHADKGLPPPHGAPVKYDAEVDVQEVTAAAVQQHVVQVAVAQAQQVAHLRRVRGEGGRLGVWSLQRAGMQ